MSEKIHPELLRMVEGKMALWVRKRIVSLPNEARFRANNAVTALYWAGGISTLHSSLGKEFRFSVPATFCLTHALEEAVVAFVGCASVAGYQDITDKIRFDNHVDKSALIWVMTNVLNRVSGEFALGLAYSQDQDRFVVEFKDGSKTHYAPASLELLGMKDARGEQTKSFAQDMYAEFSDDAAALRYLNDMANRRNVLMYATAESYLTGPEDMTYNLREMSKTTLGALWATIDLWENRDKRLQLVEIFLQTALELAKKAKGLKNREAMKPGQTAVAAHGVVEATQNH